MYKLRLIKGLSYSGAVSATRNSPFVSVENIVKEKGGYCKSDNRP